MPTVVLLAVSAVMIYCLVGAFKNEQADQDRGSEDVYRDVWTVGPDEANDPSVLGFLRANLRVYFGCRQRGDDHNEALSEMLASRYVLDYGGNVELARTASESMLSDFMKESGIDTEYEQLAGLLRRMHAEEAREDGIPVEEKRLGKVFVKEIKRFEKASGTQLHGS